jgi:dihydrofolate synthase/folylpolyglutamate synthase
LRDPARERFEALFGPEFGHGKPFDLDPLRAALSALRVSGTLPSVIHVAGTNGKGSTIAFMRAILEAAGFKVHAFTKPHLFKLNERFVVASEIVSDDVLIEAAEHVYSRAPTLTQFDAQVATALTLFDENDADATLLETGMGGRDDSTNVIFAPAITVITPIGFDHQDALGATLPEIAAHKAGIFRRYSPAVIAHQQDAVREVLEAHANEAGAPMFRQGVEWDAYVNSGRLIVQTERQALDLPLPTLHGAHQTDNAGLACAALLAPWRHTISDDAFARGIQSARWPGRLQPLMRGPFSAPIRAIGGEVWIDGAHNEHGAQALAHALRAMQRKREAPTIAIVGMLERKNADSFVAALAGAVDHIIAVPLAEPHIAPALISTTTAPSLADAMQNAAQFPAPRVLICGSFVLAAEALAAESA